MTADSHIHYQRYFRLGQLYIDHQHLTHCLFPALALRHSLTRSGKVHRVGSRGASIFVLPGNVTPAHIELARTLFPETRWTSWTVNITRAFLNWRIETCRKFSSGRLCAQIFFRQGNGFEHVDVGSVGAPAYPGHFCCIAVFYLVRFIQVTGVHRKGNLFTSLSRGRS